MIDDFMMKSRVMTTVVRRVMVVSAKGGVGKSTTTVNLAAALSVRGYRVGIFDADAHGPNVPALLGIRRKSKISNHPENMVTIEARVDSSSLVKPVRPYERYGLQLASLALRVGEMQTIQPQEGTIGRIMTFMLRQLDWGGADLLLFDMPPGTGEPLDSLMQDVTIDGAVIVTTREQLAHMDNGRILSKLKRDGVPILGIVENMTHIVCPNCGELVELYPIPVGDMKQVYGPSRVLGSIPFDPALIRNSGDGPPLPLRQPDHPVAKTLLDTADALMRQLDFVSPV